MEGPVRILVVDDDPDVRDLLNDYLSGQGYQVAAADGATAARSLMDAETPDLVLLDAGLPGEDGLSLARHIRERFDIGIIMISGAGETLDRIVGLEVGADDYVAKPFDPRELKARLKSVLRRYRRAPEPEPRASTDPPQAPGNRRVAAGACVLDLDSRQLFDAEGTEIPLTRDQILNLTQNRDWDPFDRSIDIRVARLRRKIEPDPDQPRYIRTVRGLGYMYVPAKAQPAR